MKPPAQPAVIALARPNREDPMPLISRRKLMFAATGVAAAALAPRITVVQAQTPPAPAAGPFTLPPLTYATNALEPHIDAMTMEIHHDRHHAAYVNNLNG